MSISSKDWNWEDYAIKYTRDNVYKQKRIFDNKSNVFHLRSMKKHHGCDTPIGGDKQRF